MESINQIERMTLKEKVTFCSGKDEWHTKAFPKHNIAAVMMSDGPNGLRKQTGAGDILGIMRSEEATCFPSESLLACSFDKNLAGEAGAAIAEEAGAAEVSMFLGPGVNHKRNPLCGRNFEYFSEDPYLSGKLAAAYITAAQKKGIGTSLKHFACNNQEDFRMISDSRIDERTLRELYLTAFEYAVKESRPACVMCAYNQLNGVYCSDHRYLLTDILRGEWGYEGFVVTDWGAIHDRSKSFAAGCDLVMPGGNAYGERDVCSDIKTGALDEAFVDRSTARLLRFVEQAEHTKKTMTFTANKKKHHALARQIAEESAVLLKNEDNILPCTKEEIVLIGHMAKDFRYQGHGSSRISSASADSLLSLLPGVLYAPGCDAEGNTTKDLLAQAVKLAQSAKKVILVAGLPDIAEAEGLDRSDMQMPPGHNLLIQEIAAANPNTAVVLCCGCAVETPWADDVKAILYMGLSGQAGAGALVNLLTGRVNPSGRLAETWPIRYEDCPSAAFYGKDGKNAEYREGIYAGYRYYETAKKPVRFPFGAGLSYTTFSYHDLTVSETHVSVTVTNTGSCFGGEAVLMYVRAPQNGIHRPVRELKGFEKIFLAPGQSREVCFALNDRTFAVWNDGWRVYAGEYAIQIGPCKAPLNVAGEVFQETVDAGWYRTLAGIPDRNDWLKTLAHPPVETPLRPYTIDSTVEEVAKDSLIIRLMYGYFEKLQARASGRGTVNYQMAMKGAQQSPLRNVQNSFLLKGHFAQAVADFGNKKFLSGIRHLLR